jgi:hypothetical protein
VRAAISGLASSIYKASASFQAVDSSLPPLWRGLKRLSMSEVQAALASGADPNETNPQGARVRVARVCCLVCPATCGAAWRA